MARPKGARLLRAWRVSRGLTQLQSAITLGTTPTTINLLENGKKTPLLSNAFAWEDATDGEVPARSWTEDEPDTESRAPEAA
jgi:transcriptional regulator with XRE-family HTH domain